MKKIVKIDLLEENQIVCHFDNNEARVLKLAESICDKYAHKILSDSEVFKSAKIGSCGEIYWSNVAEIMDLDGEVRQCDYDISPDFAYVNSIALS